MDGDVMTRGIADATPEVRCDGRQEWLWRQGPRLSAEPILVLRKTRVAVHSIELEGHPMGTQIPLFQHPCPDSPQRRQPPRSHVIWPAIAEHQDVGDLMFA